MLRSLAPSTVMCLTPDADLSGEDADVQAIAGAVFTDAAKAAYAAASQE
jgi:hypothetical protein